MRGYQTIDVDLCLPDIRSFIEQQITLISKGQADHACVVQHVLHEFMAKFAYFVSQVFVFLYLSFIHCSIPYFSQNYGDVKNHKILVSLFVVLKDETTVKDVISCLVL